MTGVLYTICGALVYFTLISKIYIKFEKFTP